MAQHKYADLNAVKPGDTLVKRSRDWPSDRCMYSLVTVVRTTKTQVLTESAPGGHQTRWSKKSGRVVGYANHFRRSPELLVMTDELRQELRLNKLRGALRSAWKDEALQEASEAKLLAIKAALELADDVKGRPMIIMQHEGVPDRPYPAGSRYGLAKRSNLVKP